MKTINIFLFLLWFVTTILFIGFIQFLLNQRNDGAVIAVPFISVLYLVLTYKSNCFTKNPFTR